MASHGERATNAPARGGWARGAIFRAAAGLALLAITTICLGFLWFVWRVPNEEIALNRNAEGIVVLTGGAARIADAIDLLAAGRGQRLLITGVNPGTTAVSLARLDPRYERWLACCIDLDHIARNTIGNAVETRHWTRARGFRSLVVVTSAYHMPRAMAELADQLPDITLIEYPVIAGKRRADPWWASAPAAKLMVSEYLKFVVAMIRMRLTPAPEPSQIAAS